MGRIFMAFIPICVAVDALGVLPIYISLTQGMDKKIQNKIIRQSILTASLLAFGFIFLGKFIILKETLFQGRNGLAVVFLATLGVIFIGMARIFIMMTLGGTAPQGNQDNFYNRNTFLRIWVPALFFVLVITLGVYFPYWLKSALGEVAHELGGG